MAAEKKLTEEQTEQINGGVIIITNGDATTVNANAQKSDVNTNAIYGLHAEDSALDIFDEPLGTN